MAMLLLLSLLTADLQHDGQGPAAQPATRVQGLGRRHHPIATNNPEAQQFFDQGLIFVHASNYRGAVDSTARAPEIDREYIKTSGATGVYPMMYYNHARKHADVPMTLAAL